ncbi:hypothetical protein Kisp01_67170 [Kineosporia sp. NBRC 101677]|uniref:hypothetical protein n=1 Tax=Kineosporia sp. NBRC 101677 TaxID=3032197 RepID=UPI0024A313D0|nr:hypothetical protein [Kineosporia sp. NBRC 101677]GLY19703.1 hypothetical protein Kisp01_67170 [Kineosporia sp. NBRC 101677]
MNSTDSTLRPSAQRQTGRLALAALLSAIAGGTGTCMVWATQNSLDPSPTQTVIASAPVLIVLAVALWRLSAHGVLARTPVTRALTGLLAAVGIGLLFFGLSWVDFVNDDPLLGIDTLRTLGVVTGLGSVFAIVPALVTFLVLAPLTALRPGLSAASLEALAAVVAAVITGLYTRWLFAYDPSFSPAPVLLITLSAAALAGCCAVAGVQWVLKARPQN